MKTSISRQHIYLLASSLVLLIFVLIFSFGVLIPAGKEYRIKRVDLKKVFKEYRSYQNFHSQTEETLQDLRSANRRIITAFDTTFKPERFEKQHKEFFSSLSISNSSSPIVEKGFSVYEVNTTSQINSPKSFYDFLEKVNKSDFIIAINFPIDFKREGEMITSSFKMKVYCNSSETNATTSGLVDK